jgi:hypothetical protein
MRHFASIVGAGQPPLAGRRVYLAGPRTSLDPAAYAQLEAALMELGVIETPVAEAFGVALRVLRAQGAEVTCPFEAPWWRGGGTHSDSMALRDVRAGRERDARALESADLVVVLDGWEDVPGAVDTAVIVAESRDVPWARVSAVLASCREAVGVPEDVL